MSWTVTITGDKSMSPEAKRVKYIYVSKTGGKPLNIGINAAKRLARIADQRDQQQVLATLGSGLPRQHARHQELVRQRHQYYTADGGVKHDP